MYVGKKKSIILDQGRWLLTFDHSYTAAIFLSLSMSLWPSASYQNTSPLEIPSLDEAMGKT